MPGSRVGGRAPFLVSLAVLAACLFASSSSAGTLVTSNGRITAFAHDGGRIAWITGRCGAVRIRTLWSGHQEVVGTTLREVRAGEPDAFCNTGPPFALGLGGTRAVWTAESFDSCSNGVAYVKTGALGERQRRIETLWPCYLTSRRAAGDGDSLVYAHVHMDYVEEDCDEDECRFYYEASGDRVTRVVGETRARIPGARPSVAIAVSGRRLAMVPAQARLLVPVAQAARGGPVEIRNVRTGALVSSFAPAGRVRAVAFSGSKVVVLVRDGSGKRIEAHAAATGALLATYAIARGAAWELDLAGDRAVYRVGRRIRLLNVSTGARRLLTTTATRPIGLSIEGSRVAWAENVRGRGYVRAINVN